MTCAVCTSRRSPGSNSPVRHTHTQWVQSLPYRGAPSQPAAHSLPAAHVRSASCCTCQQPSTVGPLPRAPGKAGASPPTWACSRSVPTAAIQNATDVAHRAGVLGRHACGKVTARWTWLLDACGSGGSAWAYGNGGALPPPASVQRWSVASRLARCECVLQGAKRKGGGAVFAVVRAADSHRAEMKFRSHSDGSGRDCLVAEHARCCRGGNRYSCRRQCHRAQAARVLLRSTI